MLEQVPSSSTQTTFVLNNLAQDTTLATPDGVRVFLTDTEQLFADSNDDPVPCSTCQTLSLEVTDVRDKGDIIAYGVPTVTTDGDLLESGGMLHITVVCDGKEMKMLPGRKLKIQIPAPAPAADMRLFTGLMQGGTFAGWENTGLQVFQADWIAANMSMVEGYELLTPHLGWLNCDRFVNTNGQNNSFCIDLPPDFNPENTITYLILDNTQSVAPLESDWTTQNFCFSNAPPSGFPVRVVTVSQTGNGQFWLGNYATEIGTNDTLSLAPQKVTDQQIVNFLKSL